MAKTKAKKEVEEEVKDKTSEEVEEEEKPKKKKRKYKPRFRVDIFGDTYDIGKFTRQQLTDYALQHDEVYDFMTDFMQKKDVRKRHKEEVVDIPNFMEVKIAVIEKFFPVEEKAPEPTWLEQLQSLKEAQNK